MGPMGTLSVPLAELAGYLAVDLTALGGALGTPSGSAVLALLAFGFSVFDFGAVLCHAFFALAGFDFLISVFRGFGFGFLLLVVFGLFGSLA